MLISIVIASRNRDSLLRRAVRSIEAQGHDPEIVIIDNVSDVPITASVGQASTNIRIVRNERITSAAVSRNIGIDAASGEIVCFLDDDDVYLPGKFDDIVRTFKGEESLDFAYGATVMQGVGDEVLGLCSGPCAIEPFLRWRYMHMNAIAVRREVFATHRFNEEMGTYEDVEFAGNLIRNFQGAEIEAKHAIWYRDNRPDQLTNRNLGRSRVNWKILCTTFRKEIDASADLRHFYYRKMALLCLVTGDVVGAARYGIARYRGAGS